MEGERKRAGVRLLPVGSAPALSFDVENQPNGPAEKLYLLGERLEPGKLSSKGEVREEETAARTPTSQGTFWSICQARGCMYGRLKTERKPWGILLRGLNVIILMHFERCQGRLEFLFNFSELLECDGKCQSTAHCRNW